MTMLTRHAASVTHVAVQSGMTGWKTGRARPGGMGEWGGGGGAGWEKNLGAITGG